MSDWTRERARVGALSRSRQPDDAELVDARRNLRAARLAEHITTAIAATPPLLDEQRAHLTSLLWVREQLDAAPPMPEHVAAAVGTHLFPTGKKAS